MAQGDLYRLLTRVSAALIKDMDSKSGGSERFRERINKYPHDLYISRDDIRDQLLIQLQDFKISDDLGVTQGARKQFGIATGSTREQAAAQVQNLATTNGLTPKQIAIVEKQADLFVKSVLAASPPRGIKMKKISGDNRNFVIRFTPTLKTANVFDAISKTVFQPAKARIARDLASAGITLDKTREQRLFNIGHLTAVSTLKATRALGAINSGLKLIESKYDDPLPQEAADALRIGIFSKFTKIGSPEYAKEFLIKAASVKPESEAANLTDSDYEAALLRDVRKSIQETIRKMPNDWAGQKSSDSIIDVLAIDLMESMNPKKAKRVGAKPRKKKTDSSREVTNEVKLKKPKRKAKGVKIGQLLDSQQTSARTAPSPINLAALIPTINQRLPEVIRSHMGTAGRLVNRTGRFSESAEVIALDKDNFTLSYTYQLSPYRVFESHSTRDPRPLIEQSIREIAQGLVAQRFALRRL